MQNIRDRSLLQRKHTITLGGRTHGAFVSRHADIDPYPSLGFDGPLGSCGRRGRLAAVSAITDTGSSAIVLSAEPHRSQHREGGR